MTDNEIIRALLAWLKLINRQKAEIERLKQENKEYCEANRKLMKVKEIAPGIKFKNAEHILFFGENVINTKSERDAYRKAFFYTLGILPETRKNINRLYDFADNCPKIDGFNEAWQTSGTMKMCRLAINLYNGFHYKGVSWDDLEADKDGDFTPYELFAVSDAFYMLEAVKIRYSEYFVSGGN